MKLSAKKALHTGGMPAGWQRRTALWSAIVAAHAAVIGFIMQAPPRVLQKVEEVIQASLIAPQPATKPPARQTPQPTPPEVLPPPRPSSEPLISVAPVATLHTEEAPVEPILAAPVSATPSQMASATPAEPASVATVAPAEAPRQPLAPPIFNADYLQNPPPQYPTMSRRFGEKGRVLLHVLVSAAGRAERVEINISSGFERLDLAAREAVSGWRFVPARCGDEHVAAWVLVPVSFVM